MKKFTEKETEKYYDSSDEIYQSFWDKNGSLHWGYFEPDSDDYLKASKRLTEIMLEKSGINETANVLDLGCGNGTTTIEIAKQRHCKIEGVDLSGVRIKNAQAKLENVANDIQDLVTFKKASATRLPYKDESFTHVWSQATIYHTHDKAKVLAEVFRVLEPGGGFIFDDLFKPKDDIGEDAQKYVYERLLFDTPYSFTSYQDALKQAGFEVFEAHDLSQHLKKNYEALAKILQQKILSNEAGKHEEKYLELIKAYGETAKAVASEDVGWGMFVCRK